MTKGYYKRRPQTEDTKKKIGLANKGKVRSKELRENLSKIHKGKHYSLKTEFKKGHQSWNYKGKVRLKRKFKRVNGKLILNAHFVWLKYNNLKQIPKGYVIHHKNGDSLNDSISNLILMENLDHKSFHNKLFKGDDLK